METFKVGDVVARKSYNFDILFKIVGIKNDIADLVGMTVRIVADAPVFDLKHIDNNEVETRIKNIENSRYARMNRCYSNINKRFNYEGTI